jgi:hypothetical protein
MTFTLGFIVGVIFILVFALCVEAAYFIQELRNEREEIESKTAAGRHRGDAGEGAADLS